jgi:hypothetical protein
VDPEVETANRLDRPAQVPGDRTKPRCTGKQRLSAVQDDVHGRQAVLPGMLGNALACLGDRFL